MGGKRVIERNGDAKKLVIEVFLTDEELKELDELQEMIASVTGFVPRKYQLYTNIFNAGMEAMAKRLKQLSNKF